MMGVIRLVGVYKTNNQTKSVTVENRDYVVPMTMTNATATAATSRGQGQQQQQVS
jgi:hypothetical protein